MKKIVVGILISMLVIYPTIAIADWDPDDGHKMHFPQMPDPNGWDIYATSGLEPNYPDVICGDDWNCSETGWVMDIHFWGSWLNDTVGEIEYFWIAIADNIPATPDIPYSRPGEILWERTISDYIIRDPETGDQGFYIPYMDWPEGVYYPDHKLYYQYNIFLDENDWFWQEKGKIYWLLISANVTEVPGGVQPIWGWKTSIEQYMDDCVWSFDDMYWNEIREPETPPIINEWWVFVDELGIVVPPSGGDDPYDDGTGMNGWYKYPSGWWNIWFYDHPLNFEKWKHIHVNFQATGTWPGAWIQFAINWANSTWPPGGPPPVPPISPENESLYVVRHIFEPWEFPEPFIPFPFDYILDIWEYNPEWISIDVRGSGFQILPDNPGTVLHHCLFKDEPPSLDLAFVITGRAPIPDLCCHGSLTWRDVKPGETKTGNFDVENCGETGSLLNWEVTDKPTWGTNWVFTPSSGTGLAAGSTTTVTVSVDAPDEQEKTFYGNITICNKDDSTDCCKIPVKLVTPVQQPSNSLLLRFLLRLMDRFPLFERLILMIPVFNRVLNI